MDKSWIDFLKAVLPAAVQMVGALFTKHDGDAELAVRDIQDRTEEIEKMWAKHRAGLDAKHSEEE